MRSALFEVSEINKFHRMLEYFFTCEMWAGSVWERVCQGDIKSITYLRCKEGENVLHRVDKGGRTLLHWAIDRNQFHIAQYLLEQGVHPNHADLCGATALDYVDILYADRYLQDKTNEAREQQEQHANWVALLANYNAENGTKKPYCTPISAKNDIQDTATVNNENSKFWRSQPVQRGTQQSFEVEIPEEISWAKLEQPDGDKEMIELIIQEVNDLTRAEESGNSLFGGVEFHPTIELLTKVLKQSYSWVGLRENISQRLVGFIAAKKVTVALQAEEFECAEVHSLVLHPKYRGKHLTPMLIQALHRQSIATQRISRGIFTTVSKLPIAKLSEVQLGYRVLRPKALRFTPFMCLSDFVSLTQLCESSKVAEPAILTIDRYESTTDCADVFTMCVNYLSQFPLHHVFRSPEECDHYFRPITNQTSSFVLRDAEGEIVGVFRLTYLYAQVSSCTTNSVACCSQLGYLAVRGHNITKELDAIFHHALYQAYAAGAHVFFAQNVLLPPSCNKILDELEFHNSDCTISYHLFCTDFTPLHPHEIGLTFW